MEPDEVKKPEEKKAKSYKTDFKRQQQALQAAARAEKVLVAGRGVNRSQRRHFR